MSSHGRIGWHITKLSHWFKELNVNLKDIVTQDIRTVVGVEVDAIIAHLEEEQDLYMFEDIMPHIPQSVVDQDAIQERMEQTYLD